MSPTERDLRDALQRGEGPGLDPDVVVAAGRAHAARRRTRIAAVSGSTALVAAVAVTVGVLTSGGSSHQPTADGGPSRGPSYGATRHTADGQQPTGPIAGPAAPVSGCPSSFGNGTARPNVAGVGDLLPADADSVLVCAYGSPGDSSSAPGTATLTGSDAATMLASLNHAATRPPNTMCPEYRRADVHRLVFVALRGGTAVGTAYTTLGDATCSVIVSSASSTRYSWAPPPALQLTLYQLHP